tara:strand:- start:524 stop:2068 length:1545 start_codon:yes stop_codon:yes gene_type:complete
VDNEAKVSKITKQLLVRSRRKLNIAKFIFAKIDSLGDLFSKVVKRSHSSFLVSKANRKKIVRLLNNEVKIWSNLDEAVGGERWREAAGMVTSAKSLLPNSHRYSSLRRPVDELFISSNPLVDFKEELETFHETGTLAKRWDLIKKRNLDSHIRKKNIYRHREEKLDTSSSAGKQRRILFIAYGDKGFFFLRKLIQDLRLREDLEVKTLDTSTFLHPTTPIKRRDLPADAKELIDWADIIFLEWADRSSTTMINSLPHDKKILLRLHSYEVTHPWPLEIDWGKIDTLVCVCQHNLMRLAEVVDLEAYGCKSFVLPTPLNYEAFIKPKLGDVSKVLGLSGYGQSLKRPDLALDLLKLLQSNDPSWKLELLGDIPKPGRAYEIQYFENFWKRAQPHIQTGTLKITPWMSDPSIWFQNVGIILSCSDREGTHESCREGLASGSMGLIRNWPWAKNYGGNDHMFPDSFHWDTVSEAADYLQSFESSEQRLSQASLEQKKLLERERQRDVAEDFLEIAFA